MNKNLKTTTINNKSHSLISKFSETLEYKFLIYLLIKRDFVTFYKQTVLGPLWYILQPLINTIVFTVVFGNIAKISTDGQNPFLFYMASNIIWIYFATCLVNISSTFTTNVNIFSKVYFPRLTVPLSIISINLIQFSIQFIFFIFFYLYLYDSPIEKLLSINFLLIILVLFLTAILSLGVGIFIASVTIKYRDLTLMINFGVQLWMFASPIIYPVSIIPEKYKIYLSINPMTTILEIFRYIFFNTFSLSIIHIVVSISVIILFFIVGALNFNRVEKNFVDTV